MFTLVRINMPSTIRDEDGHIVAHVSPDHVWDHVMENHKNWRTKDVKLLYMTRRHLQNDTSLIIDSSDPDALADFLTKHIAPIKHVRGIRVLNMAKMRFFKVPLARPHDFNRFTVTIDAMPQRIEKIFETVSALEPGRDVMINYIAQTFESFTSSIMVSVLARSMEHMESFVEDFIKPIDGVMDCEIIGISKTTRLVTPEEWQESVGPYFVAPGGEHVKYTDAYDDNWMAGC